MPAPRTQPLSVYERVLEVMRQRDSIPSDKELAKELDCHIEFVRSVMKRGRKSRKLCVSRGADGGGSASP